MAAPLMQEVRPIMFIIMTRFGSRSRATWSKPAASSPGPYMDQDHHDKLWKATIGVPIVRKYHDGIGKASLLMLSLSDRSRSGSRSRSIFVNSSWHLGGRSSGSRLVTSPIAGLCCIVPKRCYGRKMRTKPPKATHFEYSGDLRCLPLLNKSSLLYTNRGIEDQLQGNDVLTRLSSLEFSSSHEFAEHRRALVLDRMMELFGPDSELEQRIALLTLEIRQMIPYCIQYRTDKLNKIWLMKRIFQRRRLLTILRGIDHERFEWLLKELKVRYIIPKDNEGKRSWRHNLEDTARGEAVANQRKRLEELKEKFENEKQIFYQHREQVLAEIAKDLQEFGLS